MSVTLAARLESGKRNDLPALAMRLSVQAVSTCAADFLGQRFALRIDEFRLVLVRGRSQDIYAAVSVPDGPV